MSEGVDEKLQSPKLQDAQSSLANLAADSTGESSPIMSFPLSASGRNSADMMRDSLLSPTQNTLHPLPPRPGSNLSSTVATPNTAQSSTPLPSAAPRTRGGFEIDDDDDEENQEGDEDNDDVDVYDPAISFDADAPTPAAVETPLDRISQSPEQKNGDTPVPIQATGNSADISSSTFSTGEAAPYASADTPVPAAVDAHAKASPPRSNVNGSVAPAVSKSRLAHDVVGILEDRIKDDPRGDATAYLELIRELKSRNKQEEVRQVYEQYLKVFPLDAEQWCAYVKWEEENDRKYQMEQLFSRSLLEVLNVELWSIYINYIRRRNSMQSGDVAKSYTIINQAFTFALDTIGMDKDSGKLWQDYIGFLKSGPGVVGGTGWQDGAKVDTLRSAYQKALAVPTEVVTSLWREYDAFETGLSKINGRKYLQEKSASYMTARQGYTQLSNITAALVRASRPQLPPAMGCQGDVEYMRQVDLWQQWIQWEKDDNLVLKEEDLELYRKRVLFTYKQALMALQFWPEMWYSASEFCLENGLEAEATKFLDRGIAANPESPLLAFKLADRIEMTTQNDEATDPGAKERMKKVREPYDKVLDSLYGLIKKATNREKQDIQDVENSAESNANGDGTGDDEINAANVASKKAALDAQIEAVKKRAEVEIELLSKMISHAWIALMRATRRVQGKGSPTERGPSGFRAIFGEARKRGKLTSDFYVECAQIEWQCYRDPTGAKILDRGMKLFPEDAYLPLQYIKHLFEINDVTNARGVFETTVTRLLAYKDAAHTVKLKPLFSFLHEYESRFGELIQIQKLEKRMRELFPEDPLLKLFSERFITSVFDPIHVFPIVSQQQVQLKTGLVPSIEINDQANSPIQKVIDSITTNSPKRPFPDDFEDVQPRKIARGESPLKGAAGRRMNQQRQPNGQPGSVSQLPIPQPLPPQIHYLLSILPKASTYQDARFDPVKMVELIRDIHLPPPGSIPQHHHPQPPQQSAPPAWQQYAPPQQQPMPPQGYMQPPGVAQGQYGGAPFRFA